MGIRITSWNVNGIRNPFSYHPWSEKRTFNAMFDILEADIVVMQETKIQRKDLQDDMVLVPGWDVYFSLPRHKKGYSGVAIYTRNSVCMPIRAEEGILGVLCPPNSQTKFRDLPADQQIGGYPRPDQLAGRVDEATLDSEGRCVILEFPAFVLVGTYSPANRDETRDDFRLGYLEALDARVRNLVALGKRVVLTGDLNVIRSAADTAHLPERLRREGETMASFFAQPSRRLFNHLLFDGQVRGPRDEGREEPVLWDLGRLFNPDREGMFTCWDTKKNTRPGNFGSRIDYVLCSDNMKDWFADSNIQEGLMGSDHCPVFATLKDTVQMEGKEVNVRDIINPAGVFQHGERLRDWTAKDLLPMSAKLIPEFDRRQNIKDMFFKKSSATKPTTTIPASDPSSSPRIEAPQPSPLSKNPTTAISADSPSGSFKPSASPVKPAPRSLKRTPSAPMGKPSKKPKGTGTPQGKEPSLAKGQSSLMGFFKPKTTGNAVKGGESEETPPRAANGLDGSTDIEAVPWANDSNASQKQGGGGVEEAPAPAPVSPKRVFDPIESKESWSKLLGKRRAPRCEHGEDCISLTTKKAGVNCGRSFYICSRPIGPSGEKEKGTEWRCGTFIWSSDWGGSQAS
ncbi:DNase I-like protein [Xylariaceae sp. FL0804]|nr:DNase I-like protein [Xylariaceae sp. FL0804]